MAKTSLDFQYLTPANVGSAQISAFLEPIANVVSAESEYGKKNRDLQGKTLSEQVKLLFQRKYGALLAFLEGKPAGLIAFQDHEDGSRHVFLIHTHPDLRGKGIALATLNEFVSSGAKQGIAKFRVSRGSSRKGTPEAVIRLLRRFNELHAPSLGFKANLRNGFIERPRQNRFS